MDLINRANELRQASRLVEVERRQQEEAVRGDFEGIVVGHWARLQDDGTGVAIYKDKEYVTRPIGRKNIRKGDPVQLNYTNGIYFSNW